MRYITLFSDFGLQDASVAIAKGILMQHVQLNNIIDISHEVQPFNLKQAAYLFGTSYANFPKGTFHMLLFDIYSSGKPKLILSEYDGHYFLSADNPLLTSSLNGATIKSWVGMEMGSMHSFHDWLHAAGRIITGMQASNANGLGLSPYELPKEASSPPGQHEVLHIDKFGNVIINFTKEEYDRQAPGRQFLLRFTQAGNEVLDRIHYNYSDEKEGYKLCRFNSNGYLEICVNHGRAANLFGLKLGGKHNNIQITFS